MNGDLIKTDNVSLTDVGLTVVGDMTFDEWVNLMRTLVRLETAFQFAIGDALIWGEARYGEKYAQAMEATGLSYQALANMVWVSKHVPISNRVSDLSWTHHRVVASVEPQDQPPLLEMALDQGLSATGLQEHIKGKPSRSRELIPVPSGLSSDDATRILSEYASAVRLAQSGEPDPAYDPDALTIECILCASCPYKTRGANQ